MTTNTEEKGLQLSLTEMLAKEPIKKRFQELLGNNSAGFLTTLIAVHRSTKGLQRLDPQSIIECAAKAAAFRLSVDPALGEAAIVPYSEGDEGKVAQFQVMVKGVIQLALRSKRYRKLRLVPVCQGELVKWDKFTGEYVFDEGQKKSDLIMGYFFNFETKDDLVHKEYWSVERCLRHGYKYSKSFRLYGSGQWVEDPRMAPFLKKVSDRKREVDLEGFLKDALVTPMSGLAAMCAKTVAKNDLNRYGPRSVELEEMFKYDQAAIGPDGRPVYIDSTIEKEGEEGTAPATKPDMPKPAATAAAAPAGEDKPHGDGGGQAKTAVTKVERFPDNEAVGGFRYRIHGADGKVYSTEVKEFAEAAGAASKSKKVVQLDYLEGKTERDLVNLLVLEEKA